MATQTTTYTTTSYQTHDNVAPPKPPSLMEIGQSSSRLGGTSGTRVVETTTTTAANNVGNTVGNGFTSYASSLSPTVFNSIDMVTNNGQAAGISTSTSNEKVTYTTQAVPAEIRKTVTTTTRRYMQQPVVQTTIETTEMEQPQQIITQQQMIPVAVLPPLSPPMLTPMRSQSPVIIGPVKVNGPPIGYVRQIGSNQKIVGSQVIPLSGHTTYMQNQAYAQPVSGRTLQMQNQTYVQPAMQRHQTQYQTIIQPQQQQQQIVTTQNGYDMMHTDRMLMQQKQQQFVQAQMAQGMAMMAFQKNCCQRCFSCTNCWTGPNGYCCGECCACPGNRCCYPGTCQCRPCEQMCSPM